MNKKWLGVLMATGIMALGPNVLYADTNTVMSNPVEINQKVVIYGAPLASSLDVNVLTNQIVNFQFQNRSNEMVVFEIPSKNLFVEIPKNTTRFVKVTMSDPIDKHVYFKLNQRGSNLKPGLFTVTDYEQFHRVATSGNYSISDAELHRIASWKSTQLQEEEEQVSETPIKEEPTVQTEQFIRGYW